MLARALLIGLLIVGCSISCAPRRHDGQGTITVSGAWALYPMMVRWAEEFQKTHPHVRIDVAAGGAGKGMADALAGVVDIGMVSREISQDELAKGAFSIPVTKDAVFPSVSAQNPVLSDLMQRGITRQTLVGIFRDGTITTWGAVVGKPEFTHPIQPYTRSDACGAAQTWAQYLGCAQEDLKGVAVYGDPGLMAAVVKDPLGIGYNNLNYAFDMTSGLPVAGSVVVPIDANENGRADPEEILDTKAKALSAVASGAYPSPPARVLYLVTKGTPKGVTKDFVVWILTEGQAFVSEAGYVPLPQELVAETLQRIR